MAPVPASVAKQAELLRMDGNTYFKKERIGAAIDAYTEAIALCPNVAVYWTNRALCYRKREEWARVEEDCRRAIAIDGGSVKAHYMLGLVLLEKQEYASGIKELEKALDLGRGANPQGYMVEEIWLVLAKAKYNEWKQSSSERLQRLQNLRDACEKALKQHNLLSVSEARDSSNDNIDDCSKQFEYLSEVFHKAALVDRPSQVPDYLCCKITLDIFRDPVVTPSGITYERAVLLEHLQKVGKFDPLTRVPLEQHQLTPNLGIKEAVQAFLNVHGWAYNMN
ncbi:E3 ubiquitin-protein ligase CHIP-like [Dioscorea cayenensis subsp. rotundata]|uniref:E3 ubiquitin-protein ligase CHIP n=1 Tax=Dioscorea cayennensis subsp. rotundata TaxID=55577 RepID=A0AB40C3X6_DIOCR|nr:E3 ubiquitin-protein ligase CHIP-like [Dioscorea cayenensis subsp. rotundata]